MKEAHSSDLLPIESPSLKHNACHLRPLCVIREAVFGDNHVLRNSTGTVFDTMFMAGQEDSNSNA